MPVKVLNYKNGQIYKISRKDGNTDHEYYGSTCSLIKRRCAHKSICANTKSIKYNLKVYKHIRANGGWENWNVYWIEDFPCLSKKELLARERHFVETKKPTLNSLMPGRSHKECTELWRKNNPSKVKLTSQNWRKNNPLKIKLTSQNWKKNNPIKVQQQYNRRNIKIECQCGSKFTKRNIARHKKSKKHIKLMNAKI